MNGGRAVDWKLIKEKLARARQFAVHDVWDVDIGSLSALRSLGVEERPIVYPIFKYRRTVEEN